MDKLDDFNPLFWVIYFSNILFLRKFVKNFAWPARAVETDHDLSAGLGVLKISYDFFIFLNHLFQFWKLFRNFARAAETDRGCGLGVRIFSALLEMSYKFSIFLNHLF